MLVALKGQGCVRAADAGWPGRIGASNLASCKSVDGPTSWDFIHAAWDELLRRSAEIVSEAWL